MADNKYRGYLDEERQDSGISTTLGLTAAAGLGVAALVSPGFRRGAKDLAVMSGRMAIKGSLNIASYLNRAGRVTERAQGAMAYLKAADYAYDYRSPLSHLLNPQRAEQRFSEMIRIQLDNVQRGQATKMMHLPTQIETSLSKFSDAVPKARNTYYGMTQRHLAIEDIKRQMPQLFDQGLGHALANEKDKFFTHPDRFKIEEFLNKHNPVSGTGSNHTFQVANRGQFIDTVMDSLNAYRTKQALGRAGKTGGVIGNNIQTQGAAGIRRALISGFKEDNKVQDTWLSKMMAGAGYRTLAVRDALQQNEAGKWENRLFQNSSIRKGRHDGTVKDFRAGSKLASLANKDSSFLDLAVDSRMFINDAGDIKDFRGLADGLHNVASYVQKNLQVPFLRFNPLDLIHWTTLQASKQAPTSYFLRRGIIHPGMQGQVQTGTHPSALNADAAAGPLTRDYMYTGGNVYDVVSGEIVDQNTRLVSNQFGMINRAFSSMANLHTQDHSTRSFLGKLFDVGAQESETVFGRAGSVLTKFDDPNWARNRYKAIRNPFSTIDEIESSYKDLYAELNMRTGALSDDTASHLNPYVQQAYGSIGVDLTKLRTPQEVMETLGRIQGGLSSQHGVLDDGGLSRKIGETWHEYVTDNDKFMKGQRIVSDNSPYMMGPFQAIDAHEVSVVSKVEDAKRLIHQHAMVQLERQGITVGDVLKQGITSGTLTNDALDGARDLSVLTNLHKYWGDVYRGNPTAKVDALNAFRTEVNTDSAFRLSFSKSVEDKSPLWAMGPGDKPAQPFGPANYTVIQKSRGYQWWLEQTNEQIKQGVNPLTAAGKSAWGVLGQPFAGRKNLHDVTPITMAAYYMAERLDNMAAKIGLGLSNKNRGSMQAILGNQFLRRIALPYAAIQQAQWADDQFGDFGSNSLADAYANMTMDVGGVKQMLGLNGMGKWLGGMFPGADQFWKSPLGAPLKYGTFGLLGDSRSAEELKDYYEHGEDEVRKGRWWGVGSNTPWEGGKIDRFEPNWYRRMKSDYKMTDTLYGSDREYWRNHWMPTLTNPLAPLNHFLLDPDHYANKHREDRPYPVTGGIEELGMIPLVGPILNGTIGNILNPSATRRDLGKAHRKYQEDLNAYIENQYNSALGGGTLQFMPAGGYQLLSEGAGFGGGFGEGLSSLAAPGEAVGYGGGGSTTGGRGGASGASMAYLSALNLSMSGKGAGSANGLMAPARPISSLTDLRDPDNYADLMDYTNPAGMNNTLGNTWYSMTEMAGIYGFSANMFAGVNTNVRSNALAKSGQMTGYQRAFWDMEMGGLGGDVSELFRRYLPRDPRKQYYNPYRNTMPDWMPGLNYFTDFQHGDPYSKVAKGEMRLPGDAYETLNQLHPDQFGEYGAFDRFKILGDVAPYSDEYKFWRRMVSQMNTQGMLSADEVSEYQEIRDQVAQKKEKYHLYPYRFKNSDIDKQTVTVTKVIDANTFLTAENPNNPIRLANVHIKSDATEVQQWLQQYIHEGAKLTIGLDSDPLNRVAQDTMNTMHAVVYSPGTEDVPFYMDNKGQSLNSLIARKFGDDPKAVTVKQENSAVGTQAMYDKADITVGKMNEWLVHSALPNIPILGVIADKFMQVRSPLEMYKKNELYGKSWKSWTDPWDGWIQPMLETAATKNPLLAAAQGYGVGWLFGKAKSGRYHGKWLGAATFGTLAALRSIDEFVGSRTPGGDDYAWIPSRRKEEREINEYFDILKYMKYKGLYERAKVEAQEYEGIDLDKLIADEADRGERNKKTKKYLEVTKKWLSISKNFGYVDDDVMQEQKDKVRDRMNLIDQDRPAYQVGPRAMQALQYKLQYESTLYGADPNGDMTKIFRALPAKDREFFTQFMTAGPEEREEILRLVPQDQKRFYQAKWGMDVDDKPNLSSYFMSHYLPGTDWEGWRPDTNLDDIKLKVVRNEGHDATEFGLWADDEKRANASGVSSVPVFRPSMSIDIARIQKVLQGAGLTDLNVTMSATASSENRLGIAFDLVKDRSEDIKQGLSENLSSIFG